MPAKPLIVILYEETEAEQQRENGVSLASKHEKQPVPDGFIGEIKPHALRGSVWKGIEIEVLNGVKQDDSHYGKAAQNVCDVHSGMAPLGIFWCHFGSFGLVNAAKLAIKSHILRFCRACF